MSKNTIKKYHKEEGSRANQDFQAHSALIKKHQDAIVMKRL